MISPDCPVARGPMYSAQGHVAITRKEPSTAGVRVQEQRGLTAGGGSSQTEAG